MSTRVPREDEQAALDAIRALEDVEHHTWLTESHVRTPDLRLTLSDGRTITVEVTLATKDAAKRLHAAAKTMRPRRSVELAYEWTVLVRDHATDERDSSRTLKDFVTKMIPVLADVETDGGTPAELQHRAQAVLNPDRYDPYVSDQHCDTEPWPLLRAWDADAGHWDRASLLEHCEYWYPDDIADRVIDSIEPRRVGILRPPSPVQNGVGAVYVHAGSAESGFLATGVDYLVAALQKAIDKKAARGQMADMSGEKWLVVALDGNNAAGQLEGAFGPAAQAPYPDLSDVELSSFDEVWALAKTFHGKKFVVLRLTRSPPTPRAYTVQRPSN